MRQRLFGLWMVLIGLHAMKISTRPAVDSCSLKGDQISAQGFNPVRQFKAMCPEGAHNPPRHIESKSFARVSSFSRHFQGAFLRGGYPGLKP